MLLVPMPIQIATAEKKAKVLYSDSLFVWSKETITELNKKKDDMQKLQLDAIAYLWEICYDVALARDDNVSQSPGFGSLGLRNNHLKWKRDD